MKDNEDPETRNPQKNLQSKSFSKKDEVQISKRRSAGRDSWHKVQFLLESKPQSPVRYYLV